MRKPLHQRDVLGGDLAQQAQLLADAGQRRADVVLERGVRSGAHLVDARRRASWPRDWMSSRSNGVTIDVLEAVAHVAQHAVGLLLGGHHGLDACSAEIGSDVINDSSSTAVSAAIWACWSNSG